MTAPAGPILFNNSTGSDSLASGLGPATAVNSTTEGTTASYSGTTITFSGATNLSGVTAGHMLYLNTSTGRKFFVIASVNDGADTLTVDDTPTGTASGLSWAIGGKRATLQGSSRLYVTSGDMKGGWTIELESGYTETFSARWDNYMAGSSTLGPATIRGASGAATRPVITLSGGTTDIVPRTGYQAWRDFDVVCTGSPVGVINSTASHLRCEGLKITCGTATYGFYKTGGLVLFHAINCEVIGGTVGLLVIQNSRILGCSINGQSSHGIEVPAAQQTGLTIEDNAIYGCGGDGIKITQTRVDQFAAVKIAGNSIDDCAGDGIDYSGNGDGLAGLTICNNVFTRNGGYGLLMNGIAAEYVAASGAFVDHNAFGSGTFANTSGARSGVNAGPNDVTLPSNEDPYVDTTSGDYTVDHADLIDAGFPQSIPGV